MDIKKLRSLTKEAIEEKAIQAELERQRREKERQLLLQQEIATANKIINGIELTCETAARNGKSNARVMEVKYDDFKKDDRISYSRTLYNSEYLQGVPKRVWDYLSEAGLSPYIDMDHDGVGVHSWYYISVKW